MSDSMLPPPQNWQRFTESLSSRGKHLLETGVWSDCQFVVGVKPNQEVFHGHSLLLSMASPIFHLLCLQAKIRKQNIVINDVSAAVFKEILQYIYTDEIKLTSFDQAYDLYKGGKEYKLLHLQKQCAMYLKSVLHPTNVCKAYEFAVLNREDALMGECLIMMEDQTKAILEDKSFLEASINTLLTIFELEEMNITSEIDLFNALVKYSDHHTKGGIKTESGDKSLPLKQAIMKIRFLTLTSQEFTDGPANSNLLNESEKLAILMKITSPDSDLQLPSGFSTSSTCRKVPTLADLFQQVINDVKVVENSGQWLFSCYGPFKGKLNFPGFEDQSFEEMRAGFYQARDLGVAQEHMHQFRKSLKLALKKLKSLQNPSRATISAFTNMYHNFNWTDQHSTIVKSTIAVAKLQMFGNLLVPKIPTLSRNTTSFYGGRFGLWATDYNAQ